MTYSIKKSGMFGLFLPATIALAWPMLLALSALTAMVLTYTADGTIMDVLTGQVLPEHSPSVVFTLPVYLLFSMPYMFCINGGLTDFHYQVLSELMSAGVYSFIGFSLTIFIAVGIIGASALALKKTFGQTNKEAIAGTALFLAALMAVII